ncbi:MAG: nicotinate-nucleotide adenylyltransferase [Bacteroidetes bacterium]|nr:nicotinate-nucleotide adenylyltransferase [Bacteroidota bacterium]
MRHNKTIGLLFGSFNPVHSGHMKIAKYMIKYARLDEVWFVVSPLNPLKKEIQLAPAKDRLKMVRIAMSGERKIRACSAEFGLPKPSYTITTLRFLLKNNPGYRFAIIMGADNLHNLRRWRQYRYILDLAVIYVYPRKLKNKRALIKHCNILWVKGPLLNISSTAIRKDIARKKNVFKQLPGKVPGYIRSKGLFG